MFKPNKLTYRGDYFKKNKGIAGSGVYTCAYCGKLCFGKSSVHIDHIFPKSKMYLTASKNATSNLVTSCPKCNQKKSNKITPLYMTRGYLGKIVQTVLYNKILGIGALALTVGSIAIATTQAMNGDTLSMSVVAPLALGALGGFTNKLVWGVALVATLAIRFVM